MCTDRSIIGLFNQETTTPEYPEFEEYADNTFEPEEPHEEDDYPLTGRNLEFQPSPDGVDHPESVQPAGSEADSSPSEDSGHQLLYRTEDVPLTSEPRYGSEPAVANPAETAAQQTEEQQPQVRTANKFIRQATEVGLMLDQILQTLQSYWIIFLWYLGFIDSLCTPPWEHRLF